MEGGKETSEWGDRTGCCVTTPESIGTSMGACCSTVLASGMVVGLLWVVNMNSRVNSVEIRRGPFQSVYRA